MNMDKDSINQQMIMKKKKNYKNKLILWNQLNKKVLNYSLQKHFKNLITTIILYHLL